MGEGDPALSAPATGANSGVLGVERSLTGKRWTMRLANERTGLTLAQRLGVAEVVGRVLAGRGVELDQAESFFNPTLRQLLPDPSQLKDMDAGAERLARAIVEGQRIAVFGDYDVDGATSAALLARFLATTGSGALLYVPDRIKEGYGPNSEALLRLKAEGASVVVTVDCGISAHQALEAAAAAGLDVIVCDHHMAETRLPQACAVINPNRLDDTSACGSLAAVGVAFLVVVAVNRILRRDGYYADRPEPDLRQWLDLVALGTVCDMVPLRGVNRAFVVQGLKVMARRDNIGIRALADVAGIDETPRSYHAGFVLGPRINAGGRVGEAGLGARLLSTDDPQEAASIARRLDDFNRERQKIELRVLDEAIAQIEALDDRERRSAILVAAQEEWHPGVVGIVASRLVERFNRPACVVALKGDLGTASGRSIPGVDLGAAVNAARQAGLLVKGGGHAMAAGFTVARERLAELREFLVERLANRVGTPEDTPTLHLDGVLSVSGASAGLLAELAKVGPFGMGNPEPRFVIANARLAYVNVAGTNHLRCVLVDDRGTRLDAMAFRCLDRPLGAALRNHAGALFHFAGKLQENSWRGQTKPRFVIDDAAPVF